jgi:hypothetical protein
MAKRIAIILLEAALILCTAGLIVATCLPIDRFRSWLQSLL